ncbi:hypothetical protein CTZ27_38195 [Streptomyces griseocarneus]|nr:hypothetical protein CTZ27_38195 [Streptomyces griseocarneus]
MTLLTMIGTITAAGGLAVVAFSIAAKLLAWQRTVLAWPVHGPAAYLAGPQQTIAAETAVTALAITPVSIHLRLTVLAALYLTYTVAALALRGRDCGCFGTALHTRFTYRHAGACAATAMLTAAAATHPAAQADTTTASAFAAGLTLIGAATAAALRWPAARTQRRATDPANIPLIDHIIIYGTTNCPHCRGLWNQKPFLTALSGRPVTFHIISQDTTPDTGRQAPPLPPGTPVPAAIGYNATNHPVYGPATGTTPIRDLLTATASQPTTTHIPH